MVVLKTLLAQLRAFLLLAHCIAHCAHRQHPDCGEWEWKLQELEHVPNTKEEFIVRAGLPSDLITSPEKWDSKRYCFLDWANVGTEFSRSLNLSLYHLQTDACNFPSVFQNKTDFLQQHLQAIGRKRIIFVGDSLTHQQCTTFKALFNDFIQQHVVETFSVTLQPSNKTVNFELPGIKMVSGMTVLCIWHNHLVHHKKQVLVDICKGQVDDSFEESMFGTKMDVPFWHLLDDPNTVGIINTGAHWYAHMFGQADLNNPRKEVLKAFRRMTRNVAESVVQPFKGKLFVRGMSPAHKDCQLYHQPLGLKNDEWQQGKQQYNWEYFHDFDHVWLETIEGARTPSLEWLDISFSEARPDAHSVYILKNNTATLQDCLHWDAAAVPYYWNLMLLHKLTKGSLK